MLKLAGIDRMPLSAFSHCDGVSILKFSSSHVIVNENMVYEKRYITVGICIIAVFIIHTLKSLLHFEIFIQHNYF